jgi:hypothetical protein
LCFSDGLGERHMKDLEVRWKTSKRGKSPWRKAKDLKREAYKDLKERHIRDLRERCLRERRKTSE